MLLGIFDSGVGGLTLANALRRKLPEVDLLYLGDTLHMPYGDKGPESLKAYSRTITRFLLEEGAEGIVIACNSASSYAYEAVCEIAEGRPVFDVIRPVIQRLGKAFPSGNIGIVGTRATIRSGIYPRLFAEQFPGANIQTLATPLLAPFAEEGIEDPKLRLALVGHYLGQPEIQHLDALVLACTHYPLLKTEFRTLLPAGTALIDPAEILAEALLEQRPIWPGNGEINCLVTEWTPAFAQAAQRMFGETLEVKQHNMHHRH